MTAPSSLQKIVAYLQGGPDAVETMLSGPRNSMSEMAVKTTEDNPNYFAKLKEYEGFKPYVYLDSKKIPTAGLGHKVLKGENFSGYTDKDYMKLFEEKDLPSHLNRAKKLIPEFDSMPNSLKEEVVASVFRGDLSGSPATLKLINSGKFKQASAEFLNNDEYRDAKKWEKNKGKRHGVAVRMENLSNELKRMEKK